MRIVFACLLTVAALAQDSPQWRGANRDGVVASFQEPKAWPETLKPVWKVPVGIGHASPVVVAGKVYLFSRLDDKETAASFDLESGKALWKTSYAAPFTMHPAARGHGEGPKSTPLVYQGKLYTLGISGILSCFDLATGKLKWQKDFAGQFSENWPDFGTSMSPVADRGLIIAHVGGNKTGALTAFAAETGEVKWAWKGEGPGYASPIVADLGGTRQVVTQSRNMIVSVSAANGDLLWSIPFTTEYVQNIVTPVIYGQTVILSGINKGTFAVRPVKKGSEWIPERVWQNEEIAMYMNSPVLGGDLLFGMSHKNKGQYFALDPRTGAKLWTSPGRDGDNAAILLGGDSLFLLNNDGELIVAKKNAKSFEPVRRYKVADSATWAHPVVVGHRVLIKDLNTLALLSW